MTRERPGPPRRVLLPWDEGPERELLRTRILSVHAASCTSRERPHVSFEASRVRCADWVNVIALTPEREVVLIEQYRHGTAEITLEIPGGLIDEGETPEEACARELLEETGYAGGAVRMLGMTTPNPAFMANRLSTGLIVNARQVAAPAGDETEEIAVSLARLGDVPDLIRSGAIHHALVVAAFHLLALDPDTER